MKRMGFAASAGAILFAVAACALSCKGKSSKESGDQPCTAATLAPPDETFIYAEVTRHPAPVPARFSAALPGDIAAFEGDWSAYPPPSFVADRLCAGDEKMQRNLLRAAASASRSASASEVVGAYSGLLGHCSAPGFCAWAHEVVNSHEPLPARALLWHALASCTDEEYAPDFARPGAPASAVVSWTMAVSAQRPPPLSARLMTAAREILQSGTAFEARLAAVAISSTEDPSALPALLKLHEEAPDAERKDAVAMGLHGQGDPRAREIFAQACARSRDALCPEGGRPEPDKPLPDATADPEAALLDYRVDIGKVLHAHRERQPALATALAGCVDKSLASDAHSDWITYRCLAYLEVVDRAAAVALAKKIPAAETAFAPLAKGVAGLLAFPSREAMLDKLRALGLVSADLPAKAAREPILTIADLLERAGRYQQFDTETGQFPNEHDSLLRALAALARPDLDGVVFEEVAPPFDADAPQAGHYVLNAYADGCRYAVRGQNLGDWYDVEAVIGLLNMLLRENKSQTRLVVLPTGDQTSAVLAGPASGLLKATSEGLIELAGATAGVEAGKEFERKVLDRLGREP